MVNLPGSGPPSNTQQHVDAARDRAAPDITAPDVAVRAHCPSPRAQLQPRAQLRRWGVRLFLPLCLVWLSTACLPANTPRPSSTPPVEKIGLIASFEGFYRETGYAALDGLRAAIDACTPADSFRTHPPQPGYVPLALDDSHGPQSLPRTLAKLQIDPSVALILGPYTAAEHIGSTHISSAYIGSAHSVSTDASPLLWLPALVHENGQFADANNWESALAYYIRATAQSLTSLEDVAAENARMLVSGAPPAVVARVEDEHQSAQHESSSPHEELSIVFIREAELHARATTWTQAVQAIYEPGDLLLRLEMGPESPGELAELRRQLPSLPIIFGPEAAATVLAQADGFVDDAEIHHGPLYWAVWSDGNYTDWVAHHLGPRPESNASPIPAHTVSPVYRHAYLVYRATCAALTESPVQFDPMQSNNGLIEAGRAGDRLEAHPHPDWTLHLLRLTSSH